MDLSEKIYKAGVVGAGGAGFPTHVKAKSEVEFILANGAECEPLLHKDFEIMVNRSEEIVKGMELMFDSVKAKKGFFGVKTKNALALEKISGELNSGRIEITELGDFYPSGDEYELVYEATGRLIPPAGLPIQVGCVVNNVETFYNVYNAYNDIPVTEKFLCVAGAVKKPSSFFAPIGASFKDIIEFAGGATVKDYGIFVSGVMMGRLTFDENEPITKTVAGLIVLPKNHYMIQRMNRPEESWHRIGKSACDQCTYCTEFCPRYLLGYNVQPHKVMRSLVFTKSGGELWNQMAELCCACGLCTLYACPEDLYPKEACLKSKAEMREAGIKYVQPHPPQVHPIKEGRRVPLKMLVKKLNLQDYDVPTPYVNDIPKVDSVKILLKQHVGETAEAKVKKGEFVEKGAMIAEPPEGKLGATVHASISGTVQSVEKDYIIIS